MLSHFHFPEETREGREKKEIPYEYVYLEDALQLPSLEEVEILPEGGYMESQESARLEAVGAEILEHLYMCREKETEGVSYKGTIEEEYRI